MERFHRAIELLGGRQRAAARIGLAPHTLYKIESGRRAHLAEHDKAAALALRRLAGEAAELAHQLDPPGARPPQSPRSIGELANEGKENDPA